MVFSGSRDNRQLRRELDEMRKQLDRIEKKLDSGSAELPAR